MHVGDIQGLSEVSVPLVGCAEQSCEGHSGDLSFFLISLGQVHHLLPQGGAAPGRQSRLRDGNWTCLPQEPTHQMWLAAAQMHESKDLDDPREDVGMGCHQQHCGAAGGQWVSLGQGKLCPSHGTSRCVVVHRSRSPQWESKCGKGCPFLTAQRGN